jgi:glucose-6-phosphate isomerase
VEDNVDPERMKALLDIIDVKKTMFNVITKSGSTSETMSQYLIIMDILKSRLGKDANNHMIATTSETKGNLIKIAKKECLKTFYIPEGVGGRFSELSPVGLLPAAVLGIDIKKLLKGAKFMDKLCQKPDIKKNPALMAATLQYIAMASKGKNISVMMPYADSLKLMADWYAQLWGESLGKAMNLNGNKVFVGQTPVKALGVTDQHSQVQLYIEGPFDKVVTFIGVENYRNVVTISDGCEDIPDVSFLCGHTMNELITAEMNATEYALTRCERLNSKIILPEVNAFYLGQLMTFFMMQTAFAGAYLNIDTFNQPGVEEGKNATYALLGRAGYEAKAEELNSRKEKSAKYII